MVTPTNSFSFTSTNTKTDQVAAAPVSENKDMFTKLLVAQIQNQDPLAPSDPSEFVNQLSMLSQTEALENMTQTTVASASILQSLQVLGMGGQVGTQITVGTSRVELGDKPISGAIQLGGASTLSHVILTDVAGKQTRIELPPHAAGAQDFTIDAAALGLAPGKYSIAAEASDGTRPSVEITGRLDSVRLSSTGAILLQVAGVGETEPGWITGFKGNSNSSTAGSLAALTTNH